MANVAVSALTELLGASLDANADALLVSDMSARLSKRMTPANIMRASLYNLTSVYDFTTGSLGPFVTFTRASTGWYRDSAGAIAAALTDVPRFAYDPVALTPRGLLIEQSTTNQFAYSDEFDNAYWTKTRTTIAANAYGTMDKLIEDTQSTAHSTSRTVSVTAGTVYCFSAFFKAAERSHCVLTLPTVMMGSVTRHYFDIGTGALGTGSAGGTEFIEHVGGGVYRCTVLFTCSTTHAASAPIVELWQGFGSVNYTGDGVSGYYIGGASFTDATSLTSPILTTGAALTRAADEVRIANPAALVDQCWIVKARTPRKLIGVAENVAFQVDDGTGANARVLIHGTDGVLYAITTVGGVINCFISLGAVAGDTDFTVAVRWADNNFAASLNGGAVVTDTSGLNPLGLTTARVGSGAGTNYWNSTIRRIETRRTASNAELQALSV
jgi:hypothetical protein